MTIQNEVYTDHEGFGFYTPGKEPIHGSDNSCYNYVFHYNGYVGLWAAIPRDVYNDYWSDSNTPGVIRSRSIQTLVEILYKTQGDPSLIEQLTREQ